MLQLATLYELIRFYIRNPISELRVSVRLSRHMNLNTLTNQQQRRDSSGIALD